MTNLLRLFFLSSVHARLRFWTAITLYLLILVIGSVPGARQDIGEVASGLILHSIAYAGLAFLIFTGSKGQLPLRAAKAVLTIAVMGALDEYVQSYFPYRHAQVSDWVVDCSAALAMSLFMSILWNRLRIPVAE